MSPDGRASDRARDNGWRRHAEWQRCRGNSRRIFPRCPLVPATELHLASPTETRDWRRRHPALLACPGWRRHNRIAGLPRRSATARRQRAPEAASCHRDRHEFGLGDAVIIGERHGQSPAFLRHDTERQERIGGDGGEEISLQHGLAIKCANEMIDDVARNRLAHLIAPLPALHRMRDQQFHIEWLVGRDLFRNIDQDADHDQSMQAARVTSRSTLSRQHEPSRNRAMAITVCEVANRIRVVTRGAPDRGPKRNTATRGNGLPSANTWIASTGEGGSATDTVIATELPFSTMTGRSRWISPSFGGTSPVRAWISAATSAGA